MLFDMPPYKPDKGSLLYPIQLSKMKKRVLASVTTATNKQKKKINIILGKPDLVTDTAINK